MNSQNLSLVLLVVHSVVEQDSSRSASIGQILTCCHWSCRRLTMCSYCGWGVIM